jgi:hypothetical protein
LTATGTSCGVRGQLGACSFAIAALTVPNGRIATMDILRDPARLARLDLTAFDSQP